MVDKLEQLIARLEAVTAKQEALMAAGGAPASSGPAAPQSALTKEWIKAVLPKVKEFEDATKALNIAQVTTAVEQWLGLIDRQPAMFSTMDAHSKPADYAWAFAKNGEVHQSIDTVKAKDFKSPPNHLQVLIDGIGLFAWPAFMPGDEMNEMMKESVDQIAFYGNKILKMNKDVDTAWYSAYKTLAETIRDFLINPERIIPIGQWRGKESPDGAQATFEKVLAGGSAPNCGGAPAAGQPQAAAPAQAQSSGNAAKYEKEVLSKVAAFKAAADALGIAQVSSVTDQFISIMNEQPKILSMLPKFKKPADMSFLGKNCGAAHEACATLKQKDFKAPPNHLQCVIDGFAVFSWIYLNFGDELKDMVTEYHQQCYFYGNKVLKLDKPLDTAWFEAYSALITAHKDFIVSRCEDVNIWSGKEDGAQAWFESNATAGGSTPAQQTAPKPVEEKKVEAAPVQAPKPKAPVAAKVKAPVKEFRNSTWYVENYKEGEELFEGSDNVNKRVGFNLYANQNCTVTIKGKCRSLQIEACKKMTIYIDSCVSEIYMMNCQSVKIFLMKEIKTCTIESSKEISVNLTKSTRGCTVTSTCCRGVFVRFPKSDAPEEATEEDHFNKMPVPETYESKIEGDELVTTAMDCLE